MHMFYVVQSDHCESHGNYHHPFVFIHPVAKRILDDTFSPTRHTVHGWHKPITWIYGAKYDIHVTYRVILL